MDIVEDVAKIRSAEIASRNEASKKEWTSAINACTPEYIREKYFGRGQISLQFKYDNCGVISRRECYVKIAGVGTVAMDETQYFTVYYGGIDHQYDY